MIGVICSEVNESIDFTWYINTVCENEYELHLFFQNEEGW